MFFDVFAFVVFGVLFLAIVIAIVALGSLPGNIARRRGHPQADAITAAGWMGIATAGLLWPLAFVWAFHRPAKSGPDLASTTDEHSPQLLGMQSRLEALELAIDKLQPN